jgi:hypothetical protein
LPGEEEHLPERERVRGVWRKLHNEKFHKIYSTKSIISVIIYKGNIAYMEQENCIYIVSRKPGRKRPLERSL